MQVQHSIQLFQSQTLSMEFRIVLFAVVLIGGAVFAQPVHAQQRRPCGPDSIRGPLRLFIPQGAAGADFKPACIKHDACYGMACATRNECDQQFLCNMLSACDGARRPNACRRRAFQIYRATNKYGLRAFQKAQSEVDICDSIKFER